MKEFEWLLNKEEKEIIRGIEVYLGLNNLNLDISDKINSVLQEEKEIYRYVYRRGRKNSVVLVIEYIFNFFGLDSIYLVYKIGSLESIKTFYNIEEFRDFLLEIL